MTPKRLYTLEEIDALPDLEYLIEGVIPDKAFCVLYGEPGCGKSFVALSMALACATGQPWIGRASRNTDVLYLAAEGVGGMKYRVRAWRKRHKIDPEQARFYTEAVQITVHEEVVSLLDELRTANFQPGLVIIDTLARVSVGKDENSAKDMWEVIAGVDALRRKLEASILVIHHTRKDGNSERGSSALRGAADVMVGCKTHREFKGIIVLSCSKTKDDEPFPDVEVGFEKVQLGHGKSSLVAGDPPPLLKRICNGDPKESKNHHHTGILQILVETFGQKGATQSELKKAFCEHTKASESTFNRAWTSLKDSSEIRKEGDHKGARYFPISVSVKVGVR